MEGKRYCEDHGHQPWKWGFIALFTIVPGLLTCGLFFQQAVVAPEGEMIDEARLRRIVREELARAVREELPKLAHVSLRDSGKSEDALTQVEEYGRRIEAAAEAELSDEEEDELRELQDSIELTKRVLETAIAYAKSPTEENVDRVLRIFDETDLQVAVVEFGRDRIMLGSEAKEEVVKTTRDYLERGRAVSLRLGTLDMNFDCSGAPRYDCGELEVEATPPGPGGRLRWLAPEEAGAIRMASFGQIRLSGESRFNCLARDLGITPRSVRSWRGDLATVRGLLRDLLG